MIDFNIKCLSLGQGLRKKSMYKDNLKTRKNKLWIYNKGF